MVLLHLHWLPVQQILDFYVNAFKIIVSNILCDTFLLMFVFFLLSAMSCILYFKQAKQSLVNI